MLKLTKGTRPLVIFIYKNTIDKKWKVLYKHKGFNSIFYINRFYSKSKIKTKNINKEEVIILLPRKARSNLRGYFFHVMVQGINKEFIFQNNEYKEKYINLLKDAKDFNIKIIAFCIMDNHAHLLVEISEIKRLSEFMWKINFEFAKYYNKEEKRVGVVFRNRYRLEEIYEEKYLLRCIAYIHNNPVKAGIVKDCKEYRYSNYNEYKAKNEYIVEYQKQLNEEKYNRFIDVKEDEDDIERVIANFVNKEQIELKKVKENKTHLKRLIKHIKNKCNVSNIEISKKLNISKTTVWNYLNKD